MNPTPPIPLTSTGYQPGDLIYSRDGRTIYQVQKDGAHRKLPREQAAGEFKQVLADQARAVIEAQGSLVAVPGGEER